MEGYNLNLDEVNMDGDGIELYLKSGKSDYEKMAPIFDLLGEKPNILEIGCCTGRIMRHFIERVMHDQWTVHGTDIVKDYIDWCNQNLRHFECFFEHELTNNFYDFIYAQSLFTHIPFPEKHLFPKIYSLLKPGGYAFFTIQDQASIDRHKHNPGFFHDYFEQKISNFKYLTIKERIILDERSGKDCKVLWNRDYFIKLVGFSRLTFVSAIERAHRNCQVGLLFRKNNEN